MSTRDITSRHIRRGLARIAAVGAAAALVSVGLAPAPAHAEDTGTQTKTFHLGDLDDPNSGVLNQFDPALGTLTAVHLTAKVTMDFTVCVTNLSEAASTVNSGSVSGEASVTFAGGVVADAAGSLPVPPLDLAANTGTDGCANWEAGGNPDAPVAGANSQKESGSGTDTWSTTITDPAALAPYVGKGTVGFDYTAASSSDLAQPSEWTLVFLADGAGEVTARYSYVPGEVAGEQEVADDDQVADDGEVASAGLPNTGGPNEWLLALGAGLVLAGAGLVMVRRPHSA